MNLPDTSTMRAPGGAGQFARVPAQTIRPSRATTGAFGIDAARGSIRVPPTSAMAGWAEAVVVQASNKSKTLNSPVLRGHRSQLCNRVHVSGSAFCRCWYLQFRAPHVRPIAHVNLSSSETDFLLYSSRYAIETVSGRRPVQEDCHSAIR